MIPRFLCIVFVFLISNSVFAQQSDIVDDSFYVDVFINANKTIYVGTEKTDLENVTAKVSEILRNNTFELDQVTVYRTFADETLPMGFITDVTQEMISAHDENVRIERYLLNSIELNIDGQNWFDAINMEELKKLN